MKLLNLEQRILFMVVIGMEQLHSASGSDTVDYGSIIDNTYNIYADLSVKLK